MSFTVQFACLCDNDFWLSNAGVVVSGFDQHIFSWKYRNLALSTNTSVACINSMSRLAADCFAAAGRLQYTSFQTNSVDLNDALLVSN